MIRRMVVACALLGAAPALAEDKATQAKADVLFEKGQKLYEAGQFQAAIPLFQEAFDLVHDPVYLFNIGQSYRKVLDCENASAFYAKYLAAATDADAKQRDKVAGWIRELQSCVDQRRKEHDAVKRAEDQERARQAAERAPSRPAPPPIREHEVDRGHTVRLVGIVVAGVGVAALGAATAFSVHGKNLRDELSAACAVTCDWTDPALRDKDSAGQRANTLATMGWIGGGVAVLAGAGLYLWGRTRTETITVAPSATGATVSARFSF